MKRQTFIVTAALAGLLVASVVAAAPAASPDTKLDAGQRKAIVEAVTDVLKEQYIFEDVAEDMERLVKKDLKSGEYAEFETLGDFTKRLTDDLRSVSNDLHLRIDPLHEIAEEDPEEEAAIQARQLEQLRRENYGFRKIEVFRGNIGYLQLSNFRDASVGGQTAVAAMNYLANCDALIVDLRMNGGGSPSMIQLISSYFFDEPQHLNSFYIRKSDITQQFWTQANVEGPKMVDTPIYVLTSGNTFSAAEEFTYNLKNMERATIVGETTGGGAHPVTFVHRPEAMVTVKVPFGRAINPISKTNWEGTGVEPDIAVPAADALMAAKMEATRALIANAPDEEAKAIQQWALETYEAYLNPATVDPTALASFVGRYGPRHVRVREGALHYQRDGGMSFELVPMGNDLFAFRRGDDYHDLRVQFEKNDVGQVSHFILMNAEGLRLKSDPRTDFAAAGAKGSD
jgi:hypothetical protein